MRVCVRERERARENDGKTKVVLEENFGEKMVLRSCCIIEKGLHPEL